MYLSPDLDGNGNWRWKKEDKVLKWEEMTTAAGEEEEIQVSWMGTSLL
jgi:hypothetical protein